MCMRLAPRRPIEVLGLAIIVHPTHRTAAAQGGIAPDMRTHWQRGPFRTPCRTLAARTGTTPHPPDLSPPDRSSRPRFPRGEMRGNISEVLRAGISLGALAVGGAKLSVGAPPLPAGEGPAEPGVGAAACAKSLCALHNSAQGAPPTRPSGTLPLKRERARLPVSCAWIPCFVVRQAHDEEAQHEVLC
jgi:hypothetical protein